MIVVRRLHEVTLNSHFALFRYALAGGFYVLLGVSICLQWPNIYSLLFHPLPLGLEIDVKYSLPVGLVSLFSVFSVTIFGLLRVESITIASMISESFYEYKKEILMKSAFGLCFGCLTGLLSSLIFVLFEQSLPSEFLQYDVLFKNLDVSTTVLLGIISSLFFVWGILQFVLSIAKRCGLRYKPLSAIAALAFITLGSLLISIVNVSLLVVISGSASIALISFCSLVSFIAYTSVGVLYWLVGIEASMIANVTFGLAISCLARMFL